MSFQDCEKRIELVRSAHNVLDILRSFYTQGKIIQQSLTTNDSTFISTFNIIFGNAEGKELKDMLEDINALLKSWEKNHKKPLGL